MALLRVTSPEIQPATLFAFLSGRYGQLQVRRLARPTGQYNLNLQEVSSLKIPSFSNAFNRQIAISIEQVHGLLARSNNYFQQSKDLLLAELNLLTWQPPKPLTYISYASEAFAVNRLDAEHFQPKYKAMLAKVQKHALRCRRVEEFTTHCDRGEQPDYVEDGSLAVVNSRHILENGLDYDGFERTSAKNWNEPNFKNARIQRNDILTYMTGANVGRTAAYLSDERALASNEANILRLNDENPIYISVVMNSIIGRWQTRMLVTGSAQVHLYPNDIRNFLIPFVDAKTESAIVAAVERANIARRESRSLLDHTKRAVEIAIEKSESAALAYLKSQGA